MDSIQLPVKQPQPVIESVGHCRTRNDYSNTLWRTRVWPERGEAILTEPGGDLKCLSRVHVVERRIEVIFFLKYPQETK